jgi:hypothetical protein
MQYKRVNKAYILLHIIIIIIYLNSNWVSTRRKWYYNKTQHKTTHTTQNNTALR